MAKGLSIRGYARRRDVSEAAVRKAIRSGRITLGSDGSIDPATADRQWARNTDQTKPRNSVIGDPKHRKPAPDAPSTPMGSNGNGDHPADGAGGYAKARAIREIYNARLSKLDYEERIGSRIPIEQVQASARAIGQDVRDHLLSLPGQLAPIVASLSKVGDCRTAIMAEVRRICQELERAISAGVDFKSRRRKK